MAQTPAQFRHAVVWGKFYPPTRGHQFLIQSALDRSGRVTICASSRAGETIPIEKRIAWLRELFPTANVVATDPTLPYTPDECPTPHHFYEFWRRAVLEACGDPPDAAFTSEPAYDPFVTQYLRAAHVLVDPSRKTVPISATQIRDNPYAHWDYLAPIVRSHYVKTVCLYGPESTGKSTLAEALAKHFNTAWQPEFARDYLGDRHCEYPDMLPIAQGHFADREPYKRRANKILFVDTDTLITRVFSQHYYHRHPPELDALISHPDNQNDLYLFTNTDVPWVPDTSRDLGTPQLRSKLQSDLLRDLKAHGTPYVTITGSDFGLRFAQAVQAVKHHFANIL